MTGTPPDRPARDSEMLLRQVIDETPYPVILKDADGNFALVNRALAELYNTTPEAMVGKHDDDFGVPKDMADGFRANCLSIMARGVTEVVYEDSRDATTGETRHYRSIKKPIFNAQGERQLLIIAQDISDIVRSQQMVAESERRLQAVLRMTGEGIWDWDVPSGRVVHNEQWYVLLGFKDGEVPSTVDGFASLIHPDDKPAVMERLQSLMDGRVEIYESEHRLRTARGDYLWVRDRGGVAERNAQGEPVRVMGSVADISERMRQQALVEEQRRRLDDVVEATNIGLFEWHCATGAQTINERWSAIVGYTSAELAPVTVDTWQQLLHPDDLAAYRHQMQAHLDGQIPIFEAEARLQHQQGHWVWVMVRGKVTERDAEGLPLRVSGTMQDITRRKTAEERVRQSEEVLRTAIDVIDEALVIFDPDDRLIYCNERYRQTYPLVADVIQPGVTFETIVRQWKMRGGGEPPPEGIDAWVQARVKAHREGSLFVQAIEGDRWVRVVERTTPNGYTVGFRVDITELIHAKQQAEAANVAKSRFLATMSHELRTPMNGILGMAQLLLQPDLPEAERLKFTQTILISGNALLSLLNDILDLSKVESGKMVLEQLAFAPERLLDDVQALFGEAARSKGLDLRVHWRGESTAHFLGDPARLRQMLGNLVSNALKFTAQGAIAVTAQPVPGAEAGQGPWVEFAVQDSGMGIPADKRDVLFLPFSQVDASTTRQFGGTGLGLSIVHNLVQLMGGEVGVDSEVGQGARFWFRVPLPPTAVPAQTDEWLPAPSPSMSPPLQAPEDGAPAGTYSGEVLVVEDHPMNRMVIQNMLTRQGLRVRMAHDGQQGLDALMAGPLPDIVFMDVEMPVLDGRAATARIRAWEAAQGHPRTPIVALTANAFESDRLEALQAGMDDFVAKPIRIDELRRVIGRWLKSPR